MKSYIKFKKKIVLEVLIKTLAISLSLGLISFSVPFLYYKTKGIEYNLLYLILISIGVCLVTFGLLFLILKPNDVKVAKRLDKELKLNEKVQTMIEYKDKDELMISVQREDTLNILSKTSIKNISMKFGIIFFIIIILSMSLTVTSLVIPGYEEPEHVHEFIDGVCSCGKIEEVEPDYNLDNWTVKAILELIEEVKKSSMNDELKQKYISKLNSLITDLETVTLEKDVKALVESTIKYIEVELDKVNTNNEVYTILKESNFNVILQIALQINLLKPNELKLLLESVIITISGSSPAINELRPEFLDLLTESNLDKEDNLYKALVTYAEAINNCADKDPSVDVNDRVIEAVRNNLQPIVDEITYQAENKRVAVVVIDGLEAIFKLNDVEIEDSEIDKLPGNEEDDNKHNDQSGQGGLGTGDYLFGSDDLFFDPEKGIIKYGDVYFEYYGDLLSKFEDGTLPEELREFFDYYFGILGGDANKK